MSYYSFKIKKGKVELAVVSEDKYFVTSQFDKVYRETVEKPKKTKKAEPPKPEIKPEPASQVKEEAAPPEPEKTEAPPVKEEAPPVKTPETTVQEKPEEPEKEPEVSEEETGETEEETASEEEPQVEVLKPEEEASKEAEETVAAEDSEPEEETEVKEEPAKSEEFQKIIEEKLKEEVETREVSEESGEKETITYYEESDEEELVDSEEIELAETLRESFDEEEPVTEAPKKGSKVYDILQEKLSSIPEEERSRLNLNRAKTEEKSSPSALKFKNLDDLLYLKKPQTKLDYLLITSYFFQENEEKEKYSLKQINAKVIPLIKEPIDHSVVHEAVAHGYFEVVPDENSDITEYTITLEGVDYILNEL